MTEPSPDQAPTAPTRGARGRFTGFHPRGGRPKGRRNKVTALVDEMFGAHAAEIVSSIIERAKAGDPTAMRLAIERIAPPVKSRPTPIKLPPVATIEDIPPALAVITAAVSDGLISSEEAKALAEVVEVNRRALELVQVQRVITDMEGRFRE